MRDDEQRSFDEVAMPHLDAAYNLARWLCGNSEDADDITQEAFLRAFRFFHTFRGDDARTWILKIVRNTFYSFWRQGRRHDSALEFDEELHSFAGESHHAPGFGRADLDPETLLRNAEDIRMLERAIHSLPDEFRETLVLREIEELSYKQIAAALDVPIGTVMSRLARGRQLLAKAYEALQQAPRNNVRYLRVR